MAIPPESTRLPDDLLNDVPKLEKIDLASAMPQKRLLRNGRTKHTEISNASFSIPDGQIHTGTINEPKTRTPPEVKAPPKILGQNRLKRKSKTMASSENVMKTVMTAPEANTDVGSAVTKSRGATSVQFSGECLTPGTTKSVHESTNKPISTTPSHITDTAASIFASISRKDVASLRENLHSTLAILGASNPHHEYPSDIRSLLILAEEENIIYDNVFQEMIRQCAVIMSERGQILAEIRQRYANMFSQIPKVVKSVYTELCAERVKNRRLGQELLRMRDSMRFLSHRIIHIQRANELVSLQGNGASSQLLDVLARAINSDEILSDYHDAHCIHRNRLETQICHLAEEKKVWMDIATHLALRIGSDHGLPEVAALQKFEYGRLRAVNHMISLIATQDHADIQHIYKESEAWVRDITEISTDVEHEDSRCRSTLQKMLHEVRLLQKWMKMDDTLSVETTALGAVCGPNKRKTQPPALISDMDATITSKPLVLPWNDPLMTLDKSHDDSGGPILHTKIVEDQALNMLLLESQSVDEVFKQLVESANSISMRYTSNKDEYLLQRLTNSQIGLKAWLEISISTAERGSRNSQRLEYLELLSSIKSLGKNLQSWIAKLKATVLGDNGIATGVITFQNQMEDRRAIALRHYESSVSVTERRALREYLGSWSEQLSVVLVLMKSNSFGDEKRLSVKIAEWVSKLMEELSSETQVRSEANIKLHESLVRWMLQLLVKTGRAMESWDLELIELETHIDQLHESLNKLTKGSQLLSDDRKDLRQVARSYSDAWVRCARGLLQYQKHKGTIQLNQKQRGRDALDPLAMTNNDVNNRGSDCKNMEARLTTPLHQEGSGSDFGSRELDVLTSEETCIPSRQGSHHGQDCESDYISTDEILDFESVCLEQGKNGQGSYSDVTDVVCVAATDTDNRMFQ